MPLGVSKRPVVLLASFGYSSGATFPLGACGFDGDAGCEMACRAPGS
jgi:hypothetical protein